MSSWLHWIAMFFMVSGIIAWILGGIVLWAMLDIERIEENE